MANRFQLWGQAGWASAEVVGETHYAKAIRALFAETLNGGPIDPRGTDITVPVQLIPDRNNRHDRNAIGVWSGSSLLGHLPRPEAARYAVALTTLTTRGLLPEVNAQMTGREWGAADGRPATFDAVIRLDLAEPHMIVPANPAPAQEHRLLPSGSAVQVIGQQQNLDALYPLLRAEGECWAYVTLHEMADHLVEVRIGDARVGELSAKMSGELLPVLRHIAEQGMVTAARAIVRGDQDKSEVMLYVARVQDLPDSWQGTSRRAVAQGRGTATVQASFSNAPAAAFPTAGASHTGANGSPFAGTPHAGQASSRSAVPQAGPAGAPNAGPGPGMSVPAAGNVMSGGPASGGLVPSWVSGDDLPSWASPGAASSAAIAPPGSLPQTPAGPLTPAQDETLPAPGQTGSFPPPVQGGSFAEVAPLSPAAPLPPQPSFPSPFAASLGQPAATGSPAVARHAAPATSPVQQVEGRGFEGRGSALTEPAATPVSPAPIGGDEYAIAETTVIPALAAVVKANSGAIAGLAPVSPAAVAEPVNPHPPIPPAPTGIQFVVPAGWPTPPAGWYPPEGWCPDPSWPPAPSGWQFWVPTWD